MYDYEVNQTSGYVDKGIGFTSIFVEYPVHHGSRNPADRKYFLDKFKLRKIRKIL